MRLSFSTRLVPIVHWFQMTEGAAPDICAHRRFAEKDWPPNDASPRPIPGRGRAPDRTADSSRALDRPTRRRARCGASGCRLRISLFGALVVLLIGGAVLMQLASEQAAIVEEARKHTSNLARAFEEHIRRTVKEVDQTLLVLKRGYESDPRAFQLWE